MQMLVLDGWGGLPDFPLLGKTMRGPFRHKCRSGPRWDSLPLVEWLQSFSPGFAGCSAADLHLQMLPMGLFTLLPSCSLESHDNEQE